MWVCLCLQFSHCVVYMQSTKPRPFMLDSHVLLVYYLDGRFQRVEYLLHCENLAWSEKRQKHFWMHTKALNICVLEWMKMLCANTPHCSVSTVDAVLEHKTEWQFKDITEFHLMNSNTHTQNRQPCISVTTKHLHFISNRIKRIRKHWTHMWMGNADTDFAHW